MCTVSLMLLRAITMMTSGMSGMIIVGMVNFVMIEVMNKVYIRIATRMTDWENHCTQTEYDDQLIAKCFIFQFFNSYSSFFYLAFLEGHGRIFGIEDNCPHGDCMTSLGVQLATIFVMHLLLGQCLEVVWPWLQRDCEEWTDDCRDVMRVCCRNVCRRLKHYWCYAPLEDDDDELYAEVSSGLFTDEEYNGFRPTFP